MEMFSDWDLKCLNAAAGAAARNAGKSRNWYFIAEQPAPAPHLAHPKECAALRFVLGDKVEVERSFAAPA